MNRKIPLKGSLEIGVFDYKRSVEPAHTKKETKETD
jgi:hypothetical protein